MRSQKKAVFETGLRANHYIIRIMRQSDYKLVLLNPMVLRREVDTKLQSKNKTEEAFKSVIPFKKMSSVKDMAPVRVILSSHSLDAILDVSLHFLTSKLIVERPGDIDILRCYVRRQCTFSSNLPTEILESVSFYQFDIYCWQDLPLLESDLGTILLLFIVDHIFWIKIQSSISLPTPTLNGQCPIRLEYAAASYFTSRMTTALFCHMSILKLSK